jgi:hypothetical protein
MKNAIIEGILEVAPAIVGKGETNFYLEPDAEGIFKIVQRKNDEHIRNTGKSAFQS